MAAAPGRGGSADSEGAAAAGGAHLATGPLLPVLRQHPQHSSPAAVGDSGAGLPPPCPALLTGAAHRPNVGTFRGRGKKINKKNKQNTKIREKQKPKQQNNNKVGGKENPNQHKYLVTPREAPPAGRQAADRAARPRSPPARRTLSRPAPRTAKEAAPSPPLYMRRPMEAAAAVGRGQLEARAATPGAAAPATQAAAGRHGDPGRGQPPRARLRSPAQGTARPAPRSARGAVGHEWLVREPGPPRRPSPGTACRS